MLKEVKDCQPATSTEKTSALKSSSNLVNVELNNEQFHSQEITIKQLATPASHQESSPSRIIEWVNRLQKINNGTGSSYIQSTKRDSFVSGSLPRLSIRNLVPAAAAAAGVQLMVEPGETTDEGDLCFRTSQLITELLLMLFAACLLLIVAIVLISKKIPTFMESYEIVPKILFFLCIFVAAYSFTRWVTLKLWNQFEVSLLMMKCCLKRTRKGPAKSRGQLQRQKPLVSDEEFHQPAVQLGEGRFAETRLEEAERAPIGQAQKREDVNYWRQVGGGQQAAGACVVQARSCPPPTRQVAFDSANLRSENEPKTIEEESIEERSFASA